MSVMYTGLKHMHSHYNPGGFPPICAASDFLPLPKRGTELDSGYSGERSIGLIGTNFNENCNNTRKFSLKKMQLKMSSAISLPHCLGHWIIWLIITLFCICTKNVAVSAWENFIVTWFWSLKKREYNYMHNSNFSSMSCWWSVSTVSYNGLVSLRWPAIIW